MKDVIYFLFKLLEPRLLCLGSLDTNMLACPPTSCLEIENEMILFEPLDEHSGITALGLKMSRKIDKFEEFEMKRK